MHSYQVSKMVQQLQKDGLILKSEIKDAENSLKEYWENKIAITWSVEDIMDRARDISISITEDQAKEILQQVLNRHDASIGVNWDVFDDYIIDAGLDLSYSSMR
jgi:ClpP class serine protease